MPNGEQYEQPPEAFARAEPPDTEEASMQEFAVPDPAGGEAAAVSMGADALTGVPAELLEAKSAIERQLEQQATQMAGAASVESFQGAGNIQGVAIGLGEADDALFAQGGEPGNPALTLYVAEPTSPDQVRSVLMSSLGVGAAAADSLPLNVVVTGVIEAQPHRFRIRPAPGGVSIGHFAVTAGTLGCLATGRSSPRNSRVLLLSNNHVIANSNNASYGHCISQPGNYDGGRCPADQIAILERFVPINFSGACNYVDCGTGWCWHDRVRRELCYVSGGSVQLFRIGSTPIGGHPPLGTPVGKTGRTTQLTSGRVTAVGVTINVNYGGGKVARFCDQFAVRASSGDFSAGGDSGSVIWTWDSYRRPVGLLFAGGGGTTFANRMDRVVAALDINLLT